MFQTSQRLERSHIMATETVINRPAPFVEDIGKKLSEQALGLQQVPVVYNWYCWYYKTSW